MDSTDHLDRGLAWTAERIAHVTPAALDAPTPCGGWSLRELLDHLIATSGAFADALVAPAAIAADLRWPEAFADIADRTRRGWADPGALDRTYELPFGTMPGPVAASANLLEVVVHGWDVGRATGEDVAIPDALAEPILAFARTAIGDDQRGDAFAADLGVGDAPGERLVAYLGRTSP